MSPKEIIAELQETYGDASLKESQIYYWIREIRLGREDLNDLPRSGRPVDEQLTITIQREHKKVPSAGCRQLARKIHIPPSTVLDHMKNRIGMKLVILRSIPHLLTNEQKIQRVKIAKILLHNLSKEEATGYEFVLTGDESWFVHNYQQKEIWVMNGDNVPDRINDGHYTKKSMFTIFVNGKGLQIIDLKPEDVKITADYFIKNVLSLIEQSNLMKKAKRWKHKLCLHYDNAPSHTAKKVKIHNQDSYTNIWDHPPYSPDLAICDFGLFGTIKNSFTGNDFEDADELKDAIENFFSSKDEVFFQSLFSSWIERLQACIRNNGEYTH